MKIRLISVVVVSAFVVVGCGGDDDAESNTAADGSNASGASAAPDKTDSDDRLNASGGAATGSGGFSGEGGDPDSGETAVAGGTAGTSDLGGIPGTGGSGGMPDAGESGGVGGMSTGGTPGDGPAGGSAGSSTLPSITGPAIRTARGVLTNLPDIEFINSGGDLVITSAYFDLTILPDFNSVRIWGDVENNGVDWQCLLLADIGMGGFDITGVVDGAPYTGQSSVSTPCIPPAGAGVFFAISNEVTADLLTILTNVTYSIDGLVPMTTPAPHPGTPTIVSPTIEQSAIGWAVSATLQAASIDIYNLDITFYIRDSSGLLRDDISAFPGELGTIVAESQMPFESYSTEYEFDDYEVFMSFIEGAAPNAMAMEIGVKPSAEQRRAAQWLEAKRAYRLACLKLRTQQTDVNREQ